MGDEEVRELERRAERDPAACLELAHRFERLGDPARALEALWRGCDDLQVRRATARLDTGRAPLRSARLLWQAKLDRRDTFDRAYRASPLAVLLGSAQRTAILDPRTGEKRADAPPGRVLLLDEVALISCDDGAVVAHDAWTAELLYSVKLPGTGDRLVGHDRAGSSTLVTAFRGEVLGFHVDDVRKPPREVWRCKTDLSVGHFTQGQIARDLVVLQSSQKESAREWGHVVVALDRRDGTERFRSENALLSPWLRHDELIVVLRKDDDAVRGDVLDADGSVAWSLPRAVIQSQPRFHEVTGETVTFRVDGPPMSLWVLDRRTGVVLETFSPPAKATRNVEDVWFSSTNGPEASAGAPYVAAWTAGGEQLWSWRPKKLPTSGYHAGLAFLPGRVYVQTGREVACLVPDA